MDTEVQEGQVEKYQPKNKLMCVQKLIKYKLTNKFEDDFYELPVARVRRGYGHGEGVLVDRRQHQPFE